MITLNASGSSVTFTFDGNSTYLNDGTITVPKNSLALIADESDMITFRKSASNDIFVSANIAEFGMTKDELMAWYKANMVGSTGGGGGVTSGEVQTMIDESISGKANTSYVDQSVSGKQDTLIAGRGISITSGETADTVSFNLPISAGTSTKSIAEGDYTTARGNYSHAEGQYAKANGNSSHAEGYGSSADGNYGSHAEGMLTVAKGSSAHAEGNGTRANNQAEHASGLYNVSNSVSTTFGDSGNTLFSVGNGRADNARHNAFEIRQNGDIYITKDGSDVKLQDVIPTTTSEVTSGSTDVVTSGGVYAKMGGMTIVKITESDYAALVDKDPDTLYVVIPDPTNP